MDKKIIDGKEYTKADIKSLHINGEEKDTLFSLKDLKDSINISFDINIDCNIKQDDADNKNINTTENALTSTLSYDDESYLDFDIKDYHNKSESNISIPNKTQIKLIYFIGILSIISIIGLIYFLFIY